MHVTNSNIDMQQMPSRTTYLEIPPPPLPIRSNRPETRSQVSIQSNSDIYSSPQNLSGNNLIVSESSKNKHHLPVRVHVSHKPTSDDTNRVYNPYQLQNDYEKYVKNGFVFEPLKSKSSQSMPENIKQSSFRSITKIGPSGSSSNNSNNLSHYNSNVNVAFSSEVISPYSRKENTVYVKNPVDNDQLLNYARGGAGHVNPAFKSELETEFQNFNNLKSYSDVKIESKNEQASQMFHRAKNSQSADGENETLYRQLKKSYQSRKVADSSHQQPNKSEDSSENLRDYEDEYDIANKMNRRVNLHANHELINSINKELKRIKTGYQPDTSNA